MTELPTRATPFLKPNETGVFEIHWSVKGRNKRKSTGETELRAACAVFVEWLFRFWRTGTPTAPRLGEILDQYEAEHVETRVVDKDRMRLMLRHLRVRFADLYPSDVTPKIIEDYKAKRRAGAIGHPSGDSTIGGELTALTSALNHAIRHKRLRSDDAPHIEKPPKGAPRRRFLDPWEAVALMAAADAGGRHGERTIHSRSGLYVRIALETGGRPEAILQLEWSQVDLERGLINFAKPGEKITSKRRPVVPISQALREALAIEWGNSRRNQWVLGEPGAIKKGFANAVRRAGLEGWVYPKILRKTWATWASMRGVSMTDIARVLGDSVTIAEKHYAQYSPGYLRAAIERGRPAVSVHDDGAGQHYAAK